MARDLFGNLIKADPFTGKRFSKKQIKREILNENKHRGKIAEDSYKVNAMLRGVEVERAHHGRDFIERKRNLITRRVTRITHVEVKSSPTAPLSKLQKETKSKKKNYRVERPNSLF